MSDLICKKTISRCTTPNMCSPFGGCVPEYPIHEKEYDELYAENQELKRKIKELEEYSNRYKWIRDRHAAKVGSKIATVVFWLDEPYEPENADELDKMTDNFLQVKK